MVDILYRTEDLRKEEINEYFVETEVDRNIIDALKGRNPVVVVGSRGVGKSFLLKKAELELDDEFVDDRILPVYISFIKGTLLGTKDDDVFSAWMVARIARAVLAKIKKKGLMVSLNYTRAAITDSAGAPVELDRLEDIINSMEELWRSDDAPNRDDIRAIPDVILMGAR